MSSKPRVFLSSTIYDFKDLRSAMRFYLGSMGFDVVLSEMNDFIGPINENSFKACMKAIESCEYFILLIGSRVGGYFDKKANISITQQEYRVAYDNLKKDKIKIISFIRKSIWNIKEDRKSLFDFLINEFKNTKEISEENINKITMHSSKFVNDADFIFNFIEEVSRKNEMLEATRTGTGFPHGNWIYSFEYFEDIVPVLKTQMNMFISIQERVILENVKREIINNVDSLFVKLDKVYETTFWWIDFIKNISLEDLNGETYFDGNKLNFIAQYSAIGIGRGKNMSTFFIKEALSSGIFQHKDYLSGDIKYSKVGEAVFELFYKIEDMKKIESCFDREQTNVLLSIRACNQRGTGIKISNLTLITLKAAIMVQERILTLSKAIVNYIDGKDKDLNQLVFNFITKESNIPNPVNKGETFMDAISKWLK